MGLLAANEPSGRRGALELLTALTFGLLVLFLGEPLDLLPERLAALALGFALTFGLALALAFGLALLAFALLLAFLAGLAFLLADFLTDFAFLRATTGGTSCAGPVELSETRLSCQGTDDRHAPSARL